jgi:hypothetical protein
LGITQLQLALKLDVTPTTTARWETTHSPRGPALERIARFAEEQGALVYANIFRAALTELGSDTSYQHSIRSLNKSHADILEAFRNVSIAVWQFSDDARLMTYWVAVVDALVPAHRLVIQRAIRLNAGVDEALARGVFTPSEAEQISDSIEGLRDLERRLVNYRKEVAEKLRMIKTMKRKPSK